MRQDYFAKYKEYDDRQNSLSRRIFDQNKKNQILNHLPIKGRMGNNPSRATVHFKVVCYEIKGGR
jgi:hypothetical protein